jgi:hypothetical protein
MTGSKLSRRDFLAAGAGLAAGIELNERLVRAHSM